MCQQRSKKGVKYLGKHTTQIHKLNAHVGEHTISRLSNTVLENAKDKSTTEFGFVNEVYHCGVLESTHLSGAHP